MSQNVEVERPSTGSEPSGGTPVRVVTPSLVVVVAVASVVILASLAVLLRGDDTPNGEVAFDEMAFTTVDEGTGTLADYRGEPLVVNFFASWCAPCRAEMPDLEEAHLELGEKVAFLGISHDFDTTTWRSFVAESGVTFPTVYQPGQEIHDSLGLIAMPSTILINADGEIVHTRSGVLDAETLRDLVAEHLGVKA